MYKIYLKQAWALIRQERLFSSVYIVGTGLAISLVMVLSIVFYVKMASIYPEMDRDRLLTVKSAALKNEKGGTSSTGIAPLRGRVPCGGARLGGVGAMLR